MSLIKLLFGEKKSHTASVAKDRLQIIIASERTSGTEPAYFRAMQEELLAVIRKYVQVEQKDITITKNSSNGTEVLDVNVTLPSST